MDKKRIIQVDEKVPLPMLLPLSIQHVFAMFGASVLVPILFQIDPGIVLFMNGFGTLLFIFLTKGKAPAYLGSSFAFLAPAGGVIAAKGFEYAQGGFVVVGLLGCLLAFIVWKFGTDWIDVILPPAAMGPVVALIGLELAGNTITPGKTGADLTSGPHIAVFAVTLGVAVFGSVLFRKFFAVIPLLIAMICGYLTAVAMGLVDFTPLAQAQLFTLPKFHLAKFDLNSILTIAPVILVIATEHIGHQVVTGKIVGRDLLKDPGLHRSLLGDNLSTAISGFVGSVPTTTYGENIGVMAVTGVYSVQVIAGAAVISLLMAFIGPLAAFISTIPGDVIGGITFLLYGMIGTSGLRILVDKKVDYGKNRNLILTSVVFVAGLSGLTLTIGSVSITGMTLAAVTAVIISLIFFLLDKAKLMND
ncbi:uracil permease [uncultured Intestinimonas sp.]|uniref:uracil permease n=1 Tax=Intestinimonas sp. HCP28S3_D6 TaxID=3438942 RepID=UPI0025F8F13B|nr:uracil permease [uncultured Intestinimonas sp.]